MDNRTWMEKGQDMVSEKASNGIKYFTGDIDTSEKPPAYYPGTDIPNHYQNMMNNKNGELVDGFGYGIGTADKAGRQVSGVYDTGRTTVDYAIDGNITGLQDQFFGKAEDTAESKLIGAGKKVIYNLIPGSKQLDQTYQSGKKVNDAGQKINDTFNDVKEGE